MGHSRKELKLRSVQHRAQRTGDQGVIQSTLLGIPRVDEFFIHDPHHEGAEVFGSQKWKLDISIGADEDSHRPNTVNFSRPRPPKRVMRSHATIVEKVESFAEQVHTSPLPITDICHVTAVQESNVNERTWSIACVPKTSAKACWIQMAITKKKCTAWIVLHGKSTPAPTYFGLWQNIKFNHEKYMQFFFCFNNIERYVKGSRRKWVIPYFDTLQRPPILTIWLVKIGTNLTRREIVALENAGF